MEDSSYPLYQRYNVDGVFNRSVISGLLYLLNHKITYTQVWDDNVSETVTVPFAYNFAYAKDQRFAQDNYTFFGRECFSDKLIDGKFDMLPRFAVTYSGSQIDANNITNRFIKAKYQKVVDGSIQSYTAFLYSIPLTLNFELEGWIDNYDTAFKIEQKIYETFYKNQTFRVLYKGMSVGCCAGFPESVSTGEKTVTYSFEQENQLKMTFNIAVETYYPSFDESLQLPSENVIEKFGFDISHYTTDLTPMDKKVSIRLLPMERQWASGTEMPIRWESESNVSDVCTVLLYYITDDGDKHIIDIPMFKHGEYVWKIPQHLSNIPQPSVNYIQCGSAEIVKNPSVIVHPNSDGVVTGSYDGCFEIVDGGEFSKSGYVQVSLETEDSSGNLVIRDGYVGTVGEDCRLCNVDMYADIISGSDPELNDFRCVTPVPMTYDVSSGATMITLGIAYPLDFSVFDEIHNILIV